MVTLFLLNSVNLKLRPKLLKDSKPGTRFVSHTFNMGDWKPDEKFRGSLVVIQQLNKAGELTGFGSIADRSSFCTRATGRFDGDR